MFLPNFSMTSLLPFEVFMNNCLFLMEIEDANYSSINKSDELAAI